MDRAVVLSELGEPIQNRGWKHVYRAERTPSYSPPELQAAVMPIKVWMVEFQINGSHERFTGAAPGERVA